VQVQTLTDVYDIDHIVLNFGYKWGRRWSLAFQFAPIHSWSFNLDFKLENKFVLALRGNSVAKVFKVEIDLPTCNVSLLAIGE
jgi:hypothetical protein